MTNCDNGSISGPDDKAPNTTVYLRSDCKKLDCERCGPIKARHYRRRIGAVAEEKKLTRFMTLTLDPAKLEPGEDSISYIRNCFAKFRVYLGRRFGSSISFISVVELQKNGNAHLHILVGRYIDQAWISRSWQSVGGGYKVDIRLVDVHRIQAYLTKYITKAVLCTVPARKKRISTSRDIKLNPKKEPREGWFFRFDPIDVIWMGVNEPGAVIHSHQWDSERQLLAFRVQWPEPRDWGSEPAQEAKEPCLTLGALIRNAQKSLNSPM